MQTFNIKKNMKRTIFFTLFHIIVSAWICLAQYNNIPVTVNNALNINQYATTVSSPQVSQMERYISYPVNLSNGLVDISIPMYDIKTKNISLPLSLKFHASGLRTDEREGSFGLRWALDAGGFISRKIKGYPDDGIYQFSQSVASALYSPDIATLYSATSGKPVSLYPPPSYAPVSVTCEDTEYDLFSYCLPNGKSGSFILKDSSHVKIPITMPYEPVKIECIYGGSLTTSFTGIVAIYLTDANGDQYRFGLDTSIQETTYANRSDLYNIESSDNNVYTWHLNSIISSDKQDTISFGYTYLTTLASYEQKTITMNCNPSEILFIGDYGGWGPTTATALIDDALFGTPFYEESVTSANPMVVVISYINFPGGKVKFNYNANTTNHPTMINTIEVVNSEQTTIRKLTFDYKKNESGKFTLLNAVNFCDLSTGNAIKRYAIDYYDSSTVPGYGDLMNYSDWWGYYSANATPFLDETISVYRLNSGGQITLGTKHIEGCSSKFSDAESMKIGMVKTITYPSGGSTTYEYEGNENRSKPCGGLRIKSITHTHSSGIAEKRSYEYLYNYTPDYLMPPASGTQNLFSEIKVWCNTITADPTGGLQTYPYGARYSRLTFYDRIPDKYYDFKSNIVCYGTVKEIYENQSDNIGSIVYDYETNTLDNYQYTFNYNNYYRYSMDSKDYISPKGFWKNANLLVKSVYNKNNQLVKESTYSYKTISKESVYDMPVFRFLYHELYYSSSYQVAFDTSCDFYNYGINNSFGYVNQEYTSGAERLETETETTYNTNGTITSVKDIEYDSTYLLPISETYHNSVSGDNKSMQYTYSFQYAGAPYDSMVKQHILTPVVEKSILKNNTLLEKVINNYYQWSNYVFQPKTVQYQQNGYPIETRFQFLYSSGNQLREIVKDDAQKIVLLYNAYDEPVVKIENASYSDIVGVIGQTIIDRIAKSFVVSASDMATINTLRSLLSNAMVSTYTYAPLIGMVTATDPRGITTNYTYDTFNRLMNIQNDDRKILNEYRYHSYNQ
jgi:YD repeat-containing protein